MPEERLNSNNKIIVDHRERKSGIVEDLINEGLEIEFKLLEVGDYIVKNVIIERKTVFDFISSMINKRLIRQLTELQQYEDKLLIIEGNEENELYSEEFSGGMHPNSIRGFIVSILINYKVPIVFTKNSKDTAKFLSIINRRKKQEIGLSFSRKGLTEEERIRLILESFPGIGPKSSKKLIEKFGSLKEIFKLTEKELKEFLGKKGEKISEILQKEINLKE